MEKNGKNQLKLPFNSSFSRVKNPINAVFSDRYMQASVTD
jgi:hypothetical protein